MKAWCLFQYSEFGCKTVVLGSSRVLSASGAQQPPDYKRNHAYIFPPDRLKSDLTLRPVGGRRE